ncbi:DUF2806 domain-containing protein [Sandarakinorhabdus rubra]|uniref:DUF2806 domain-containing protein n=1 Tax=Sandarakinorhabdus rubra TaxID=2672568 RepID=UPI0013DCCAB4|nr:DUF2806 domain-containing protein [Sandarakinorhabdus rubra]
MSYEEPPDLEENGEGFVANITKHVPEGWRVKVAKMCLQLTLGAEAAASLYSDAREKLDHIEGRSLITRRLAEVVANQAVRDPVIVERAKARFLGDLARKQENLEAVISSAVELLPNLPMSSPDQSNEAAVREATECRSDTLGEEAANPLNPDWASTFVSFAENASTDDLRQRLSSILAGEMRAPGTYPRSTLRSLAELDKADLLAMQAVSSFVLGREILIFNDEGRKPTIESLLPLVDSGLIADAKPGLSKAWRAADDKPCIVVIGGNYWGLMASLKNVNQISFEVIPLTRTGVAVHDLVGKADERGLLIRIAEKIDKDNTISIHLARRDGDMFIVTEQLYPPSVDIPLGAQKLRL